jgi:hypothetical protein
MRLPTSRKERLQCDLWDPRCSKLCPAAEPPLRRVGECTIWQKCHVSQFSTEWSWGWKYGVMIKLTWKHILSCTFWRFSNWAGFHLLLKTCVWLGSSGRQPSASLNRPLSNNLPPLSIQSAPPEHLYQIQMQISILLQHITDNRYHTESHIYQISQITDITLNLIFMWPYSLLFK